MISYQFKFVPGNFRYAKQTAHPMMAPVGAKPIEYWAVFDTENDRVMCQTESENDAAHICLALELVSSYVRGDGTANREILQKLSKLRQ